MMSIGVLRGPWLPCAALVLLAVVVWRGERPAARELWLVGAMTVCAAAARFACGLWGPLHINGQGPLWIRGALEHEALANYGPGYFELFTWVARLSTRPDRAIFAANTLLSAMSPALLYATARLTGVARGGALAAAMVLALDAVTVHTAASEGYFSSIIFFVLAVQATLALAVQARVHGDRLAAALALGAASLLAATVARIHPVACVPLALCPLVVLGAARPEPWRARIALAGFAGVSIGAAVVLSSGSAIIRVLGASDMAGPAFGNLGRRQAELLGILLVAVWLLRHWARPPWLPLLGVASLLVLQATRGPYQQDHPLWKLCSQRLFWPGLLLGAASLLSGRLRRTAWALGCTAAATVAVLVSAFPHLAHPTTEALEYRFLTEVLPNMPAGCTLASVGRAGKRVWEIPGYLIPSETRETSILNVEHASDLYAVATSGDCLVYVHASLCTSAEARALCESVERGVPLERVASRTFPAAPSRVDLPYDRSEVEVVVFRGPGRGVATVGRRPALSDGAPISPALAQAVYDRLTPLQASDGCRVVRVDAGLFRLAVGLQAPSGAEQVLEASTAADRSGTSRTAGAWTLAVSPEIAKNCAATLASVEAVFSTISVPQTQGAISHRTESRLAAGPPC